jgi:drug/metabolite transporter (DMT)-like permease
MSLLRPSASLAAAGTVVLWASAFPAISVAVPQLGPVGLSVARLAVVPAGTASLLVATAPVYASLLAAGFLGERLGRR